MKRLDWIDALKGFAILSVVIGHCIDGVISAHTYTEYTYAMQTIYDFIYAFHMPLFFAISGYVFWLSKSYLKYKSKILDFGLIYVFWSIVIWISKFILAKDVNTPLEINALFRIFYQPIQLYWYLYVLICLYILISWIKPFINGKLLLTAAVCAVGIKFLSPPPVISQIFYHLPFFLLGCILAKSSLLKNIKFIHIAIFLLLIIGNCALYLTGIPQNPIFFTLRRFIIANAAILLCFKIFETIRPNRLLVTLGVHTLVIYVIHCYFTAGVRVVMKHMHIADIGLYFFLSILLGTFIPLFIAILSKKSPYLNIFFEPLKSFRQIKNKT